MQPLLLKASENILNLIGQPPYNTEGFQLWLSYFEIYGGKLYDLLNDRRFDSCRPVLYCFTVLP